jgi:hypothetical protein
LRLSSMDFFSADDVQGSDRGAAQRSALALSLAATLPPPGAHTPTRASAQGAHRDAPRDLGPDTGREGVGDLHGHAALAQERALSNRLRLLLVPSLACLALAPANPQMSASLSPASVPLHQRVRVSKRLTGHARRPRACRTHARVCACVRQVRTRAHTHAHTRAHTHKHSTSGPASQHTGQTTHVTTQMSEHKYMHACRMQDEETKKVAALERDNACMRQVLHGLASLLGQTSKTGLAHSRALFCVCNRLRGPWGCVTYQGDAWCTLTWQESAPPSSPRFWRHKLPPLLPAPR